MLNFLESVKNARFDVMKDEGLRRIVAILNEGMMLRRPQRKITDRGPSLPLLHWWQESLRGLGLEYGLVVHAFPSSMPGLAGDPLMLVRLAEPVAWFDEIKGVAISQSEAERRASTVFTHPFPVQHVSDLAIKLAREQLQELAERR